jgi:hypothetical protein
MSPKAEPPATVALAVLREWKGPFRTAAKRLLTSLHWSLDSDSGSSPVPLLLEGARVGERENSLRMSGLPSFDHIQQRRFPIYMPQTLFDSDASLRHGYLDERLASSPPFGQSWYPPAPVIHHHHHHYAAPSRTNSVSSTGIEGESARTSLSNAASHGPTTALTTPSIGLVESPTGSSSRSRQGSGGSRDLGSPSLGSAGWPRSPRRRSSGQSHRSSSGRRDRPASFDPAEHEPKRRRAGSLSHNPFPPSGPTASNPQEPRRSSTPVDRRAAAYNARSDSSDYERHHDATPRASERRTVWRQDSQLVVDGPKQPKHDRRFSDSNSHYPTTAMPALFEDRSTARTSTGSPGSSVDGGAIYAVSDGAISSKQHSPHKRFDRPAPFAGVERTFTLGSPTKPRGSATEPRRSAPLPTMWLAPPDAGDMAQEGSDGRHVRLPSLTEALRELEVREASRH